MSNPRGDASPAPSSFTVFPLLPVEIRSQIWSFAAPLRPRVIQLFYRPITKTWHACKDGCGGLPPTIHVSREARTEALRRYTKAFDTYVDFEEDTIFISDPVFSLREPKKAFLEAEHVNTIRRLAIASNIYEGLEQSAIKFPTFYDRPSAILRKLQSLTHFTLALAEDGEGDIYDSSDDSSENGYGTDGDDDGDDSGVEDVEVLEIGPSHADIPLNGLAAGIAVGSREARRLDRLENEALAAMSKGYIRHTGNIHFESAMDNVDHWDSWDFYKAEMSEHYDEEKMRYPEWVRPKISIMVVKYGLKALGDFSEPIHYRGDHTGVVLEDSEYPPREDSESRSPEEVDWDMHDWDHIEGMEEYEEAYYNATWEL